MKKIPPLLFVVVAVALVTLILLVLPGLQTKEKSSTTPTMAVNTPSPSMTPYNQTAKPVGTAEGLTYKEDNLRKVGNRYGYQFSYAINGIVACWESDTEKVEHLLSAGFYMEDEDIATLTTKATEFKKDGYTFTTKHTKRCLFITAS